MFAQKMSLSTIHIPKEFKGNQIYTFSARYCWSKLGGGGGVGVGGLGRGVVFTVQLTLYFTSSCILSRECVIRYTYYKTILTCFRECYEKYFYDIKFAYTSKC